MLNFFADTIVLKFVGQNVLSGLLMIHSGFLNIVACSIKCDIPATIIDRIEYK